ncbi:Nav1.4a [Anopheles sinensis]|uniref:Nav1.4a n=1 Tax=Anopheles sinensis TaxID=74873 RepID=A0A084WAW3_ANOSI|nr:Nav1.4a [Anopheles sinensis]
MACNSHVAEGEDEVVDDEDLGLTDAESLRRETCIESDSSRSVPQTVDEGLGVTESINTGSAKCQSGTLVKCLLRRRHYSQA